MPSQKVITPILADRYYHIFNRGNNNQQIFYSEENYRFFMRLFDMYLSPYVSLMAYCLIGNHFHFLIKTGDEVPGISSFEKDEIPEETKTGKIISNQFRRFFISYTMAVNNQMNLKGNLFNRTFERLAIEDEEYLKYLAFYIHYNPQKHVLVNDFQSYRHSSWSAYNSEKPSKLDRQLLLEIFGGMEEFQDYHRYFHEEKENLVLE